MTESIHTDIDAAAPPGACPTDVPGASLRHAGGPACQRAAPSRWRVGARPGRAAHRAESAKRDETPHVRPQPTGESSRVCLREGAAGPAVVVLRYEELEHLCERHGAAGAPDGPVDCFVCEGGALDGRPR